jgi:hypothetical protein
MVIASVVADAEYVTALEPVTPAVTLTACDADDGVYNEPPDVTFAAATVYVPGVRLESVVVLVTACEKLFGPVTVSAPFVPPGNPFTFTVRRPVVAAYATDAEFAEPSVTARVCDAGVAVYVKPLAEMLLAAIVYVPAARLLSVVVLVSVCEKLFGPVTVTAPAEPDGTPLTVIASVVAFAAYVTLRDPVLPAVMLTCCDVADGVYSVAPLVTLAAATVYVPGARFCNVVVATTACV